jgi:hypothetical protein
MKIKQVEYSKTFNIGNYESLRIGLVAEVEQGENEREVLQRLNERVHALRDTLSSQYKKACQMAQYSQADIKKLGYSKETWLAAKAYLNDLESVFES